MSDQFVVDEDTLRDLASTACQEALSFGVNEDVFMRLARTVEIRARAGVESAHKDAERYRFGVENGHWTDEQLDFAMSMKADE